MATSEELTESITAATADVDAFVTKVNTQLDKIAAVHQHLRDRAEQFKRGEINGHTLANSILKNLGKGK